MLPRKERERFLVAAGERPLDRHEVGNRQRASAGAREHLLRLLPPGPGFADNVGARRATYVIGVVAPHGPSREGGRDERDEHREEDRTHAGTRGSGP